MKRLLVAAASGDAGSQFNIGVMYDNGVHDGSGIRRQRREAIKWLHRAARQGLPRAQSKLAEVYSDGKGSPTDSARACIWFLLAMRNLSGAHRQSAQSGFERVSSNMTQAEIARAHHLADAWRPKKQDNPVASGKRNGR